MFRKKRQIGLFFAFAALIALTKMVAAENKFNYQGYVTESGVPMHGSVPMVFELYDVSTGGAPVCSTGAQSVSVSRGRFNYVVGSEAGGCGAIDIDWSAGDFFLQVSVNGNTLSPREKVVPFPVALEAKKLNGLQAADFVLSGSANWLETSGGILTGPLTVEADIISSGDITAATGTITAAAFIGDGSGLTGLAGSDDSRVLKSGDTMTGALVVQADFFTSGSISAATGTVTALAFIGDGSGLTGVVAAGSVAKTGDTMTGPLVVDSDLAVSGEITSVGDISAPIGTVTASAFIGDGSGLTGVSATDNSRVLKTGDTMTGALVVQADFFTSGNITAATGTITADAFVGDGSGLTGIVATGGVAKTGDTMTGPLTVDANIITSGDITAATGTITADSFVGDGSGLTGIVATGGVAKTGDTMTGSLTVDANIITSGDITAATGTITADSFVGDGSGLTGIVATGGVAKTGDTMTGSLTVDANIITSGDITAATGTITADSFVGDGSGLTGIVASGGVAKTGDTMTGSLTVDANIITSGDITAATGTITADSFVGDGSGLTGIVATGGVAKTGDTMTGSLTVDANIITSGDITAATGTITADSFVGDGSGLTGIVASGGVAKTGDTMTGSLTVDANIITSGDITAATGTITAAAFVGDGAGITGISATDNTKVLKTGDTMTGQLNTQNLTPTVSGVYSLGTTDLEWNNIYGRAARFRNVDAYHMKPRLTNLYDLGADTLEWRYLYLAGGIYLGGSPLALFGSVADSAGTTQFSSSGLTDSLQFAGGGLTSVSFDNVNRRVTYTTSLATLTRGTGLTGSSYAGTAGTTWAVDFGTTAGTVAEGNHAHAGMMTGSGTTDRVAYWNSASTVSSGGLYWDNANSRLGVAVAPGTYALNVSGTANISGATTLGGTLGVTGAITGSSTVQGTRLISTIATGTAPLTLASTTVVTNLNADLLDGNHASAFSTSGHTHSTLTRGTGLTGSNYDGSASTTWSLDKSHTNCYFSSVTTLTGAAQDTSCAAGFCCAAVINADTDIAMGVGKHDGASLYFNSAFEDFTSLKIMCCPCQ